MNIMMDNEEGTCTYQALVNHEEQYFTERLP